ncbi:efflux RND transporter periplasmic adaptor subunit [Alistipes sp. OttesenSCG-928-B03]|nr:efflux RND transporter periplasmic adaptor subunit [Alistipes sp. OttesenSCG-928-B03]
MEKKKKKGLIWVILLLIVAALVAAWLIFGRGGKQLQMSTRTVGEGSVETTVMATGYVQPVDKVDVGTQVSGIVERIYVDFNSRVKKNELLAELDTQTLVESVTRSDASLKSAQSDLEYAKQNFERTKMLYEAKAATQVAYEEALNRLTQAQTAVTNARTNLNQAQVNLGYARITSPIDGVVLSRAVEEGQTVAASFNTPTLFTIANDLTKMQVEADVDEADIGKVKEGQRVTFYVDAFPDDIFTGTVNQLRLQPVVTSNVVTYTVIIEAPNPDEKLLPGMTANVTIVAEEEKGLVVPVEALYFTMTPEVASALGAEMPSGAPAPEGAMPQAGAPANGGAMNGAMPEGAPNGMPAGAPNGGGRDAAKSVWVKSGDTYVARQLVTGLQDGVNTVVRSGLEKGDEVILSAAMVDNVAAKKAASNPFMPGPRRR